MATPVSAISALPRHMSIRGDNQMFLALKPNGRLIFDAPEMSFLTCFEVIFNLDDPEGTFSVRAPNGRFWRRTATNDWIRADRSTELPDTNNRRTRFKLVRFQSSGRLGFISVLDNRFLKRYTSLEIVSGYNALQDAHDAWTEVEVSDSSDHAIHLPRFISFTGDDNTLVSPRQVGNSWFLQFTGENQMTRDENINNVVQLVDGSLAIRNIHREAFWRNSARFPNDQDCWVYVDAPSEIDDERCHFWPVRLSSNMLALRSKFNNRLCRRLRLGLSSGLWEQYMSATSSGTDDVHSRLTISEAIQSRSVFNVRYLLELATSSTTEHMLKVGEGSVVNLRSEPADMMVTVSMSRRVSTQSTFSNSFTFSQSVSTSFTAGMPGIASDIDQTTIEIGVEQNFSSKWNETTEEEVFFQTQYVVRNVQPNTKATATVFASIGQMRVPFSYTSKEKGSNGIDLPSQDLVDGMFDGVSAYNIHAVLSDGRAEHRVPLVKTNAIFYRVIK